MQKLRCLVQKLRCLVQKLRCLVQKRGLLLKKSQAQVLLVALGVLQHIDSAEYAAHVHRK